MAAVTLALPGASSLKPLPWPRAWLLLWWGLVGIVVALSLVPGDALPPLPLPGSDKIEHCVAYALLAASAVQLFERPAVLRAGFGLIALGAALEIAQFLFTQTRQMDLLDAVADALGVGAGLVTAWMPLRDALLRALPPRLPNSTGPG